MEQLTQAEQDVGAGDIRYFEVEPEDSQFYTVGVDVTHRCNMECANCYSPVRTLPDVPKEDLIRFFSRLGRRTEVRLTGGEPTLRKDLPELIEAVRHYGHRVALMTNGLRLTDRAYAQSLFDAGLRFVCISVNGADDDDVYLKTDGIACAEKKIQAVKTCAAVGFFLNLNCILIRGLNEHVPGRLVGLLDELKVHGTVRFRNIGQLGRYMDTDNFSFDEMIDLVTSAFGVDRATAKASRNVNGYEEEHNVLFPLNPHKKLSTTWIKITDWRPYSGPYAGTVPDPMSSRRGRMTKGFRVAPFFEHSKLNGY